jgi:hypothetical protein
VFDQLGRVVRYTEVSGTGAVRFEVTRTFEGDRLVKQVDTGAGGQTGRTVTIAHDEQGRATSITLDEENGLRVFRRSYDEQGRLSKDEIDLGGDGQPDSLTLYHHEEGEPFLVERADDFDADGVVDSTTQLSYIDGTWPLSIKSLDGGGVPQALTSFVYDGAAPDTLSRVELDLPPGEPVEYVTHVSHSNGHISHLDYDEGDDGTIESTADLAYDAEGRLVKNTFVPTDPSMPGLVFSFDWQEGGPANMTQYELSGAVVSTWQFERGCPDVPRAFVVRRGPLGDWMGWSDPYQGDSTWPEQEGTWKSSDPFYW